MEPEINELRLVGKHETDFATQRVLCQSVRVLAQHVILQAVKDATANEWADKTVNHNGKIYKYRPFQHDDRVKDEALRFLQSDRVIVWARAFDLKINLTFLRELLAKHLEPKQEKVYLEAA